MAATVSGVTELSPYLQHLHPWSPVGGCLGMLRTGGLVGGNMSLGMVLEVSKDSYHLLCFPSVV